MNYTAIALEKIKPGCKWVITDGTSIIWEKQNDGTYVFSNFIWLDNTPAPTKEEIESSIQQVKQELENQIYKNQREKEYPSIGDQLDALFKAGVFPEDMTAQIQAVKDKYPKPEGNV